MQKEMVSDGRDHKIFCTCLIYDLTCCVILLVVQVQQKREVNLQAVVIAANALAENVNYANQIGDDSMVSAIGNNSTVINKILVVLDILAAVFMVLGIVGVVKDQKLKKKMRK